MRGFLFAAFVVFAFVVGLLYVFRHAIRGRLRGHRPAAEAPAETPVPTPERDPDIAQRVRSLQLAPEAQQLLVDFVRECTRCGPAAVEELRTRLREDGDVELETRWTFENGRLRGFPSLRSAYLAALLEIPGPESKGALLEALGKTSSPDEAFLIASGLDRRGDGGFTAAAIDCAAKAGPGHAEVVQDLVTLVARADPEGTAKEIAARSPRGEDGADPLLLAQAIEAVPRERAVLLARELLVDPQVTRKAKERYLQSLCDRGEPELFASLREVVGTGLLDRELRITMAFKAAGSRAFYTDADAYALAASGGEGDPRAAIRERYERRLEEAELLVAAAVPQDEGAGQTLQSLHRRLAEHRARLP